MTWLFKDSSGQVVSDYPSVTIYDNQTAKPFLVDGLQLIPDLSVGPEFLTPGTFLATYDPSHGVFSSPIPVSGLVTAPGVISYTGDYPSALALGSLLSQLVFTPVADLTAPGASTPVVLHLSTQSLPEPESATMTLNIVSVNDAPVLSLPTALTDATTTPLAVVDGHSLAPFASVSITDPDAGATATVTVAYDPAAFQPAIPGTLAGVELDSINGLVTLTADTPAAVTALLQGLVFQAIPSVDPLGSSIDYPFTVTVTDDQGASTAADIYVQVGAVNDTPGFNLPAALTDSATTPLAVTDAASLTPFASVSITDPDAGATDTVTITYDPMAFRPLIPDGLSGVTLDSLNGVVTLAADTPTAVTALLQGLVFEAIPNADSTGSSIAYPFTLTVTDEHEATASVDVYVNVGAVNDAPALPGLPADPVALTEDQTAQPFLNHATILDPDLGAQESLQVSIDPALGRLSAEGASYDAATGVLSWAASMDPAAASAALASVVFTPVTGKVAPGSSYAVNLLVSVTDDQGSQVTASQALTVTAVNHAPVLGLTVSDGHVGLGFHPFAAVVTDHDLGAIETVTVTLSGAAHFDPGALAGGTIDGTGKVWTFQGTAGEAGTALSQLGVADHFQGQQSFGEIGYSITVSDGAHPASAASGTFAITGHASHDIDGDGFADLVVQYNVATPAPGHEAFFGVNPLGHQAGTPVADGQYLAYFNEYDSYHVVAVGDFAGAGLSSIVMQNAEGALFVGDPNPDHPGQPAWHWLPTVAPETGYVIQGAGDFAGDGHDSLLWLNKTTGEIATWSFPADYNAASGTGVAITYNPFNAVDPSLGWNVVGITDLNHDGKSDLVWQDRAGEIWTWTMDGNAASAYSPIGTVDPGYWHVTGVGNIGGAGAIFFQGNLGEVAYWQLDNSGLHFSNWGLLNNSAAGAEWLPYATDKMVLVADFEGLGRSSLAFQHGDGTVEIWTDLDAATGSHASHAYDPGQGNGLGAAGWHLS